jgi:hypothetical protein
MTWKAPSAVAVARPALPPIDSGLPVMTPEVMLRLITEYWSIIHPITSSLV